jgi:hypothetical protein
MHRITFAAFAAFAACGAHAKDILSVGSEPLRETATSAVRVEWRSLAKSDAPTLALPAPAAERIAAMQRRNRDSMQRRYQIGITRGIVAEAVDDVPKPAVSAVAGGSVLKLDVASAGAAALRVGLAVGAWPDGVELRVAGTVFADTIYATDGATARNAADPGGVYWTAVTDGERQRLELFVPQGIDPASVRIVVDSVSHLAVGPQGDDGDGKALGDSGSCHNDVACRARLFPQAFTDLKNSVARVVYQSGGGTYTCTGTLLNDTAQVTQIPWFFTAHHCVGNDAEASSVTTFWNYETPSCNLNRSGPNIQLQGGAQLVYSEASTDGSLLRLNSTPPAGAVFLGWNAEPVTAPTAMLSMHHPRGDIKKVSIGSHTGLIDNVRVDGQVVTSALRVRWFEGTTETGSSGGGFFTGADGGGYQLRGGLAGGTASCSNVGRTEAAGNVDYYSRFDLFYPSVRRYLSGSTTGPTRDYTGQWDLASESGRGLSIFSFGQNILFALWFVYDDLGHAGWYQLDAQWTGDNVASGRVVRWKGTPWTSTYNPAERTLVEAGTFTLTFTSATQATFAYNVDGVNRTITLTKAVVN